MRSVVDERATWRGVTALETVGKPALSGIHVSPALASSAPSGFGEDPVALELPLASGALDRGVQDEPCDDQHHGEPHERQRKDGRGQARHEPRPGELDEDRDGEAEAHYDGNEGQP